MAEYVSFYLLVSFDFDMYDKTHLSPPTITNIFCLILTSILRTNHNFNMNKSEHLTDHRSKTPIQKSNEELQQEKSQKLIRKPEENPSKQYSFPFLQRLRLMIFVSNRFKFERTQAYQRIRTITPLVPTYEYDPY